MHDDSETLEGGVFGSDAAFRRYMLRAYGADRRSVNILMALGLLLWGWMMIVPYYMLGRALRGLALVTVFLSTRVVSAWYAGAWPARAAPLVVFVIAWLDLNVLLTRYAAMARARLEQLEGAGESGAGYALEKGLLLYKALGDSAGALKAFRTALDMSGGAPVLWSLTGIALCRSGSYGEALRAFDRAPDPPRYLARWASTYRTKAERMRAMGRA